MFLLIYFPVHLLNSHHVKDPRMVGQVVISVGLRFRITNSLMKHILIFERMSRVHLPKSSHSSIFVMKDSLKSLSFFLIFLKPEITVEEDKDVTVENDGGQDYSDTM